MSALAHWWHGLAERERALLAIGGGAIAATLYWIVVVEPLAAREARLVGMLAAEHETQQWLAARRSPPGSGVSRPDRERLPDGASLLAVINDSATANAVLNDLSRVTPVGPRRVTLAFTQVPYANFMRWLLAVDTRYGATVDHIRLDRADAPGVVDVDLSLSF